MRSIIFSLAAGLSLSAPMLASAQDAPLGQRLYDVTASGLPKGVVNKVLAGLGLSDDPFLDARASVYQVAFEKRK